MEYTKLVSVVGLTGLFELISTRGDGAVVRSLDDNKTQYISARVHHFSQLESIEVYTTGDNVNLVEVLKAMDAKGGELPDTKDLKAVRTYFENVYPELDFERVYGSDMKKMIKWYQSLKKHNVEIIIPEITEENADQDADNK